MNGSNNLPETDSQPMHLCPVCLKKLQHNTGFDVLKHYQEQQQFFGEVRFAEERDWVAKRVEKIMK